MIADRLEQYCKIAQLQENVGFDIVKSDICETAPHSTCRSGVLFGLVGPLVLAFLTWETAKIRSTQ